MIESDFYHLSFDKKKNFSLNFKFISFIRTIRRKIIILKHQTVRLAKQIDPLKAEVANTNRSLWVQYLSFIF